MAPVHDLKSRKAQSSGLAKLLGFIVTIAVALNCYILLSEKLSAKLLKEETRTHVFINGLNYGVFNEINNLHDLTYKSSEQEEQGLTRVTLRRDFVTDRSLYTWAQDNFKSSGGLQNIHLEVKSLSGKLITRYDLKSAKPLSWAVEANDPSLGGFYETIDFAVQEIEIN